MAEETRVQDTHEAQGTGEASEQNGEETPITLESVMAELAKTKAEAARNKAALDKALHSNGELTKQLRAKMSASEQEEEAKRQEAEALRTHISDLENFKKETEAKERYINLGMSQDLAKEAAKAEVSGDMDSLTEIYKKYNEASLKASRDEWLKSRPEPAASKEEGTADKDPFLAGFGA